MKAFTINNKLIKLNNKVIGYPSTVFNGLKHYWRFDETSGTTAYDSVGGADGSVSNSAMLDATGKNNSGIKLNNRHYINYGSVLSGWTTATPYSVGFWAKRNTGSGQIVLVLNNWDDSYNYLINIHIQFEYIYFGLMRGDQYNRASKNFAAIAPYTDFEWNYYVFTYTGDRNASGLKGYKNGVEWTNVVLTIDTLTATGFLGGILQTGRRDTTLTYENDFQIDELGLWNRVLSANEVAELYNNGNGLFY